MTALAWMASASCAGMDPELWFPDHPGPHGPVPAEICGSCLVRSECWEHACRIGAEYGMWAGRAAPGSSARWEQCAECGQAFRRKRGTPRVVCSRECKQRRRRRQDHASYLATAAEPPQ